MSEINKIDASQTVNIKADKTKPAEDTIPAEKAVEKADDKTNLSSSPASVAGQSQVVKANDNLDKDLAFGMKHDGAMENSDKLFSLAFNSLAAQGDPEAYEKACSIATCNASRDLLNCN